MVKCRNTHRAQLSPQWQVDFKLWGMKGEMGDEVRTSRVPYCLYVQKSEKQLLEALDRIPDPVF